MKTLVVAVSNRTDTLTHQSVKIGFSFVSRADVTPAPF